MKYYDIIKNKISNTYILYNINILNFLITFCFIYKISKLKKKKILKDFFLSDIVL